MQINASEGMLKKAGNTRPEAALRPHLPMLMDGEFSRPEVAVAGDLRIMLR